METGSPLKIYAEHVDVITSILFSSSDPNLILSGSRDQSLHIWHLEQHTQAPDQPILNRVLDDDEEEATSSHSENKGKRPHKPRPNRAEREKKRATKVKCSSGDLDARSFVYLLGGN